MTVKELSTYLRLDRMTIYKMLKEGSIPASRIGHQWRFFRDDIDEWIRSLRTGPRTSILVLDGDPAVARIFEEELAGDSFDVMVVPTGEEVISLASNRQYDLVFLELRRSTIEAFKHLRENDSALPIIVSMNSPDGRLMDEAMEIGTFTLIKKPKSVADVHSIISALPTKRPTAI